MTVNKTFTKENIIGLATTSAIILFLFIGCIFIESYQTTYTMNAIVIGVEDSKVLIEDDTNNLWEFEGSGYTENDIVAVRFYSNHTDYVREDDEIKNVRIISHYN